ncbi:MAG: acetate--CoA ligase [Polyangiales bacterium]
MTTLPVKGHFAAGAHVGSIDEYHRRYERSLADPEGFWAEQARTLEWYHPPAGIVDQRVPGEPTWFTAGRLNVAVNCVDRHAAKKPDGIALIWAKNEPGDYERITWLDLRHRVGRFANLLQAHGVKQGDRVCIYMPMIPDVVVAMLACARIGAVHSVVFAGFSAEALRDRILDAGAKVLITCDEGLRGAKKVPLKAIADDALEGLTLVQTVLMARRTGANVPMVRGRDYYLDEELKKHRTACPAAWMSSESPLFVLYTSGSTGRPKGLVHTTAGYLLWAAFTHRYVFDIHDDDIHFCTADVGWITGHSYIVYGPLANGCTTVLFESVPNYPDSSRFWQVVQDLKTTNIYTSPTALRALIRDGDEWVKHDRSSLRVLGTVGEPISPEAWKWYHDVVGDGRCPVVDTWWQTETGGVMMTPLPGAIPAKPGAATLPMFGVKPVLLDEEGKVVQGNDVSGFLCLEGSWPGQARTILGDHERYLEAYFTRFPGYYFTGDGARRDEDGYYWITGRVDDVINVSGHRIGTAEIEAALATHEAVAEAAVVPVAHELKGQGIYAFVICNEGFSARPQELVGALKERVRHVIGPIATPDHVLLVDGLPKTRSGKIMRRILRKLAAGERDGFGDTSTLADPGVVDHLLAEVAKKAASVPPPKAAR